MCQKNAHAIVAIETVYHRIYIYNEEIIGMMIYIYSVLIHLQCFSRFVVDLDDITYVQCVYPNGCEHPIVIMG